MRLGTKVAERYRLEEGPLDGKVEVWVAYDEHLRREVVLKQVPGGDESPTGFRRLRAEAQALAKFLHPHVVTLYDVVQVGKRGKATSWLVMEYVPGGSLQRRLGMAPELAAHFGAQIADALVALHAKGLVHCDVKPGNVVVTPEGSTAKLADFGAAYRVSSGAETITPNGAVSYTPVYASPEVVQGQPERASDVFSLGAMVYALVAGGPPRPGDRGTAGDSFIAARQAARGEIELTVDVGPLHDVLTAMLQRDPLRRPTAAKARELLRAVAGPPELLPPLREPAPLTLPDPPGPEDSDPTGRRTVPKGHPGRLAMMIAAVVVVLALAAGGWALARGGDGKKEAHSGSPAPATTAPPASASPASASPASAASLIGDHRSADPCALAKPAALGTYGKAELDPAYGNFDRCDVIVDVGAADPVDVVVQFTGASDLPASSPATSIGRVRLVKQPPDSGECDRALLLPDRDAYIDVFARVDDSPSQSGTALLCRMADTAAHSAIDVLNGLPPGGRIARRNPPLPADSLIQLDACRLLDAKAAKVVPGFDATDPDSEFGNWNCSWQSRTTHLNVRVRFNQGSSLSAQDGIPTRLGGHNAFVTRPEDADANTGEVQVVQRTYTNLKGDRIDETVDVSVEGSGTADQLRTMATKLAASIAARLPPP